MTIVVRHTPEPVTSVDPDYEVATVVHLTASGEVPAEEVRDETFRWIVDETEFGSSNEIAIRRRDSNKGASGAEVAIVLSFLGGAAGGVAGKITERAVDFISQRLGARTGGRVEVLDRAPSADAMKWVVARAFDVRPSDLRLIEQRGSARHDAAVFEDAAGRFYGVRVESGGALTIRRLREGDW